jgi:hypothetical protein
MTTNQKVTADGGNNKKKSQKTTISATIAKTKRNNEVHRNIGTHNIIENIDLAMRMHGCLPEHSLPFPV